MAAGLKPAEEALKIKQNIERMRGERGLSALTVATGAGIAGTTWYRRMEDPDQFIVRELRGIAEVFGVSLAELVG